MTFARMFAVLFAALVACWISAVVALIFVAILGGNPITGIYFRIALVPVALVTIPAFLFVLLAKLWPDHNYCHAAFLIPAVPFLGVLFLLFCFDVLGGRRGLMWELAPLLGIPILPTYMVLCLGPDFHAFRKLMPSQLHLKRKRKKRQPRDYID